MKLKLVFAALVVAVVSLATTKAYADPDPKFYVYLAFGQSNMEGYPGIPAQDTMNVDERFKMLAVVDFPQMMRKKDDWYTAVPPLARPGCGICPADYFGRTMVANLPKDVKVGVVNISVAGCKIELFDKEGNQSYLANLTAREAFIKNISKQYGDNPYLYIVDQGKRAQKDGVIKGILLHQGESNSGDKQWPTKVKKIYEDLTRDLNLKPAETPLLVGELARNPTTNAIMAELPKILPNSYVVSAKGCEFRQDGLHFTPAGYRELGARYGEEMLKVMGQKEADIKRPEGAPRPEAKPADSQPAAQPAPAK